MSHGGGRPARAALRFVAAVLLLAAVVGQSAPAAAGWSAPAQDQTTTTQAPDRPGIIPEPDSGVAPQDAGDRGGALQTVLFVTMVGGVVFIGYLVYRQSRKARDQRGF